MSIVVIKALKVPVEAGSGLEARFAARKHSVDARTLRTGGRSVLATTIPSKRLWPVAWTCSNLRSSPSADRNLACRL